MGGCGRGGEQDGALVFQGFLSDLLKKANRPYDEPKLQEYTQTIVSAVVTSPSAAGRAWVLSPEASNVQGPFSADASGICQVSHDSQLKFTEPYLPGG